MTRIFSPLAIFAVTLVLAAAVIGLGLRTGDVRDPHDRAIQSWATVHRMAGVGAALAVVAISSIAATYFIGTGRWCREVVEAYRLDGELLDRSTRLKRRAFPWTIMTMLVAVGVVALGGAADPAARIRLAPLAGFTWSQWHLAGAFAGLAFIAWAYVKVWAHIAENQALIAEVMEHVRRVRKEQGLDVVEAPHAAG